MKTAYEIALERLNKKAPLPKLSTEQKKQLAELDAQYAAKIAEREIALQEEIARNIGAGNFEKAEQLQQQLVNERRALAAERDEKKERIRQSKP